MSSSTLCLAHSSASLAVEGSTGSSTIVRMGARGASRQRTLDWNRSERSCSPLHRNSHSFHSNVSSSFTAAPFRAFGIDMGSHLAWPQHPQGATGLGGVPHDLLHLATQVLGAQAHAWLHSRINYTMAKRRQRSLPNGLGQSPIDAQRHSAGRCRMTFDRSFTTGGRSVVAQPA